MIPAHGRVAAEGKIPMIRSCTDADFQVIEAVINEAAQAYRGAIPADCWHEPYMTGPALKTEIEAGVKFWGWDESSTLIAVMGIQHIRDVTLIRHAYVQTAHQGRGIGGALLKFLTDQTTGPLLVGTWAAATGQFVSTSDMVFDWSRQRRRIDFSVPTGASRHGRKKRP
jgi:GNAT superfamily N-acetyltransferase